ncbi:MAG TPA: serine/threonine-protein kinase [Polyangiaceae bacterium]|nr:serine/threonine-protein kinase [Polyangiaceae bacterium]
MIPLAPPALSPLSKYELIEEIGHGGMATVYRARDTRLGRDVALKLLHRHLRESAEIEARFSSEARAVAKLRHPNIVAVYDVSEENEPERYLVMELVRGQTLRQLLKEHGALPVELSAAIVLEIASALEHAHAEGVVHRDVKPENVLIDMASPEPQSAEDASAARVKLTDFGIAKLLDAQGVTSTGQVLGSPAHMAPEQIEGRSVDGRADVFSLGVLFYECIAGCLPFEGRNPAQVLRNVLEGNFRPPVQVRPEIGTTWSRVIERALQREPEARPQTVSAMAKEIREELERTGFASVRHELADFIRDPDAFKESFASRIIEGLVRSGVKLRGTRQLAAAGAQFARALAYKPGDRELLRHVSGLRARRWFSQATWGGAGLLVVGGVIWYALHAGLGQQLSGWFTTKGVTALPKPTASDPRPGSSASNASPAVSVASASSADPLTKKRGNKEPHPPRVGHHESNEPPAVAQTRAVSIKIMGAAGGTVRIDGKEVPWFGGLQHELPVGPHLFEFIPPNDSCCVPDRRSVDVVPGDDVQWVMGKIPFKDAVVDMSGPPSGGQVSCPMLFAGPLTLPGQRSIPMSQGTAQGFCVFTADGSVLAKKKVGVTAGQTTILSWP